MTSPKFFSRRNVCILLALIIVLPTIAQSDPNEVQKLLASDGKAGDDFGRSVAVQDTIAFVGAQRVDIGANTDQGKVYIYELNSNNQWVETGVLRASDGTASDTFGYELALDGDWLAVTALGDENYRGSVYMFQRQENGDWIEMQKIIPSNGQSSDYFGVGLDLWRDRLIVGASGHNFVSGSAYIYELIDGTWTEVAYLLPDELESFDIFGEDVAIAGDIAVVGAQGDDDAAANSGAVYIFERVSSTEMNSKASNVDAMQITIGLEGTFPDWTTKVGKLTSQTPNKNDSFGYSVSIAAFIPSSYGISGTIGFDYHLLIGVPGADNQAENGGMVEQWTIIDNDDFSVQNSKFAGIIHRGTTFHNEAGKSLAVAARDDGTEIVVAGGAADGTGGGAGVLTVKDGKVVDEFIVTPGSKGEGLESDTFGDDVAVWIDDSVQYFGDDDKEIEKTLNKILVLTSDPGDDDNGEDAGAVYFTQASIKMGVTTEIIPADDRVPEPDDPEAGFELTLYEIVDPAWHDAPIVDLLDKLTDDTVVQLIGTGTAPVLNFGNGNSGAFQCGPVDPIAIAGLLQAGLARTVFDEEECDPDLDLLALIDFGGEYERTNNPLILQALRKIKLTSSEEPKVLVTDAKEDVMQVGSKQINGADLPDAQNPSGLQAYIFRPEEPGWYELTHTIKIPILDSNDFSLELFELMSDGTAVLVGQEPNQTTQTVTFGPCGPGVADRDGDGIEDSIDVLPDEPSKGFFHTAGNVVGEIVDLKGNKVCIRPINDMTVKITAIKGGEDAGDTVLIQVLGIELVLDVGTEFDADF